MDSQLNKLRHIQDTVLFAVDKLMSLIGHSDVIWNEKYLRNAKALPNPYLEGVIKARTVPEIQAALKQMRQSGVTGKDGTQLTLAKLIE